MALASLWCQWNTQKGTLKQSERVAKQLPEDVLVRMLTERGVDIAASLAHA